MHKWDSKVDIGVDPNLPSSDVEGQKSSVCLARAPTESGNRKHADPRRTGRSIPDKILDRLVRERTPPMFASSPIRNRTSPSIERSAHGMRRETFRGKPITNERNERASVCR